MYRNLLFLAAAAKLYGLAAEYAREDTDKEESQQNTQSIEIPAPTATTANTATTALVALTALTTEVSVTTTEAVVSRPKTNMDGFRAYSPYDKIILIALPGSEETKELEMLHKKAEDDEERKKWFKKTAVRLMTEYAVSSTAESSSQTCTEFIAWISTVKVIFEAAAITLYK